MSTVENLPPVRSRTRPTPHIDTIWGAKAIGNAIGMAEHQAFYLLEKGQLPGARKIGSRWCISRKRLRELFESD
jgi:hypothetical protein